MAINEQRKKIRLNQRLQNLEKEAVALKKRAKSLLNLCRTGNDAHQMDDVDATDAGHHCRADEKPSRNPHAKTPLGSGAILCWLFIIHLMLPFLLKNSGFMVVISMDVIIKNVYFLYVI